MKYEEDFVINKQKPNGKKGKKKTKKDKKTEKEVYNSKFVRKQINRISKPK